MFPQQPQNWYLFIYKKFGRLFKLGTLFRLNVLEIFTINLEIFVSKLTHPFTYL